MNSLVRKIIDYILLNACSVNSSGLYNGKAGMALALFEAAQYLQDDYIEEQAFDLLQEALISKTEDVGFENGLSGIGYVLLYLMRNDFIDADFQELFGEQHQKILVQTEKLKERNNAIRLNYYLTKVKPHIPANHKINKLIKNIFKAIEQDLVSQFSDFGKLDYANNKMVVLSQFECYLKTVCDCNFADYSPSLIKDYAELYREGRIKSSFPIAYHLEKLGLQEKYGDVIISNKRFSNQDNHLQCISLRNLIELARLTENKQVVTENVLEDTILKHIPQGTFVAGYEQGFSRLLIYLTNNEANLL